jgi:N-methylhydantoinase B
VNAPRAVTVSAVMYALRALLPEDAPSCAGVLAPVQVVTRPGTVVDAVFPAPVAAGNVETSQRIVDVVLGALAQALPARIPAASQGTMNNVSIGADAPSAVRGGGDDWAYYETVAGGAGASPFADGESGIHTHMTHTLNTPVEALEHAYPLRVRRYAIRKGSGGAGRFRGGDGVVREIELLEPAAVSLLGERRASAPYGLAGAGAGARGRDRLLRGGRERALEDKASFSARAGDVLRVETPGGGGWGRAR